MAGYAGGRRVEGGYYWQPGSLNVELMPPEGGTLPGDGTVRWVKVPFPVLLAAAPVVGGLFVVLLPVYGFGVFAHGIARRIASGASRGAAELASTVRPGMVAGESHLTGAAGEAKEGEPAEEGGAPERIEKLEEEVAGRRER